VPLADPKAESPAESAMRLLWLDAGLPPVTTQVPVHNALGVEVYRLDMGVPELRYAVEYDGVAWHSSPAQRAHDRRRRQWLREHDGWDIDVLGAEQVFRRPDLAVATFRAGLARADRRVRCTA
jgi:very-short-patch-repair endonuclease